MTLESLRKEIDRIDDQILQLIVEREKVVEKVAQVKNQASADPVYYHPEREAEIIQRLTSAYQGRIPKDKLAAIFQEILLQCRTLQEQHFRRV